MLFIILMLNLRKEKVAFLCLEKNTTKENIVCQCVPIHGLIYTLSSTKEVLKHTVLVWSVAHLGYYPLWAFHMMRSSIYGYVKTYLAQL